MPKRPECPACGGLTLTRRAAVTGEFEALMTCNRLPFAAWLLVATPLAIALPAGGQVEPSSDALFQALQRGAMAEVGRLLADGVSADAVNAEGTPAVMAATLYANADAV